MITTDAFPSEHALVESFVTHLREADNPWGPLDVGLEFFYHRGRTDVVACTAEGDVVAFEAKLTRWREALQQAYRNTCFAHRSYVLLPRAAARIACQYETEFVRRRVGLCYISDDQLIVAFHPPRTEPIQPWLSAEAVRCVTSEPPTPAS